MKKMFKKSIATLIAVLMVISAMPFSAITAFAAEGVFTNNGFTLVYNSGQNRWENNNQFNIVNDQEAGNTSVGIIRYDISSLQGKNLDYAKLNFSVDYWDGDGKGLVFYYSNRLTGTNLNNGSQKDSKLAYGEGTYANTQAASKFGFDINNQLTTVTKDDTSVKTVDISNAVKSVLASNSKEFYVYIMQQTAGGAGGKKLDNSCKSGWTDTKIKPANVTINYSTSVKTDYTFDEMVTKLDNFTPYSPNAHGSFPQDGTYTNYDEHYKGLVYAKPVTTYSATGGIEIASAWDGSNSTYANLYLPTAVALYTGNGNDEITVPVMISASVARSGFTWATKYIAHSGVISGDDLSLAMSQWNGKDETEEASENDYTNGNQKNNIPRLNFMWTVNQTNYRLTTDSTTTPTANEIDARYGGKAALWANKIKVTPNFSNDSTSTVKTYNPTVTFYTTVNKNKNIDTSKGINLASTDSITVVNYKPYLDKVKTAKQDIKNMNNIGSAHYEAESLKAYVDACVKLVNLDPSDYTKYTYSSAAPNAAQTLANDINSALTAYDNAKAGLKFNYTFIDVNNNSTVVPAKNEAEALANKPDNTPATKKTPADDKANHKWTEYTWPTTATNYTFTEVGTEKFEAHDTLDGGKCSKCGYSALDLTAYNAANNVAFSIVSNGNKYTEASLAKYKAAILPHMDKQTEFTSQDQVNAATYAIVSAEVLLQKRNVEIIFEIHNDDTGATTTKKYTPAWGDPVQLDAESTSVSKWTVNVNGTTSVIASTDAVIEHVATDNATITAYVTNEQPDTKYSKVTFYGKNNAIVAIRYVADGTTFSTLGVDVPAIPFYENGKWDKAEITADGSDIAVKASYTPVADAKKCGIYLNGTFVNSYSYDSYVYLFGADQSKKYAMYSDAACTKFITYFDGVDFYSPHIDNLYIKEVNPAEMKASIGFTGSFKEGTASSFNVKFWLPEGAKLVETGVDLVAKLADGNVKSVHARATKFSQRNEYTYTANFNNNKKTIEFKPYLTYEMNGERTTVYGTSQTVEFN